MAISGPAISSALNALRMYARQVDRAAEQIAEAGLFELPVDASAPETPNPVPSASDLGEAMANMMMAQRAFSAQLRVLKSADQMMKETVDSVGKQ